MKKKLIISILLFLILLFVSALMMGFTNKTFFKKGYEVINEKGKKVEIPLPLFSYYIKEKKDDVVTVVFNTLKSVNKIENFIEKYYTNLTSCYNESYFADVKKNITIYNYYIKNAGIFNKLYLVYKAENKCEDEYVISDDWINDIENINEVIISKYTLKNYETKISNKTLKKTDIKIIFDNISKNGIRIKNKKNISEEPIIEKIKSTYEYYVIHAYYKANVLSVFVYGDKYLAFKIVDQNDHSKNALYEINNANKLLIDIYENKYEYYNKD